MSATLTRAEFGTVGAGAFDSYRNDRVYDVFVTSGAGAGAGAISQEEDDFAVLLEAERNMPRGAALEALMQNSPPPAEWWDEKLPF